MRYYWGTLEYSSTTKTAITTGLKHFVYAGSRNPRTFLKDKLTFYDYPGENRHRLTEFKINEDRLYFHTISEGLYDYHLNRKSCFKRKGLQTFKPFSTTKPKDFNRDNQNHFDPFYFI